MSQSEPSPLWTDAGVLVSSCDAAFDRLVGSFVCESLCRFPLPFTTPPRSLLSPATHLLAKTTMLHACLHVMYLLHLHFAVHESGPLSMYVCCRLPLWVCRQLQGPSYLMCLSWC